MLIYKLVLRPILQYASPIWAHAAYSNIKMLESAQNKIIKIITDSPWYNILLVTEETKHNVSFRFKPLHHPGAGRSLLTPRISLEVRLAGGFLMAIGCRCQGSVLSPTLFSLYLPDIESVIKRKCEVSAFADDIVLWKSDSDLTKLERDINLVLEDIRNFDRDHKLTFNHTKSAVYTDGSRDDNYRSGSGIYIKSQDHILRIQRRNPDGCSVFRSKLIAIDEVLGSLASLPNGKEIWILSDSRSAIQHLSNWQSVRDNVGVSILTKLKRLSISHQIHLHPLT
ncbi:uncharacterized protein TNCV_3481191 [Trichonephila clavipes]|nr:uncharacterized protein TNCV_3481191 [Trichonephila clavipes]